MGRLHLARVRKETEELAQGKDWKGRIVKVILTFSIENISDN